MYKILIVGLFMCLGCATVSGQNKEERKLIGQQITELSQRFSEFFIARNADSLAAFFSPNCHFMMEFEPLIESREEVNGYFKNYFKGDIRFTEHKLIPEEIKVYGEICLEMGSNRLKYTKGGVSKTLTYNYIFVWKESKSGKYQLRSAMWNLPENPCK
jgi:ketosteroid isomerase-like protein